MFNDNENNKEKKEDSKSSLFRIGGHSVKDDFPAEKADSVEKTPSFESGDLTENGKSSKDEHSSDTGHSVKSGSSTENGYSAGFEDAARENKKTDFSAVEQDSLKKFESDENNSEDVFSVSSADNKDSGSVEKENKKAESVSKKRSKDSEFSIEDKETGKAEESFTKNTDASYFGSRVDGKKDGNDRDGREKDPFFFSDGPAPSKKGRFGFIIFTLVLFLFALSIFGGGFGKNNIQEVSYSTFMSVLENNNIKNVDIKNTGRIDFTASNGVSYRTKVPYFDGTLLQNLKEHGVDVKGSDENRTWLAFIIEFLPMIIFIGFMVMMMRNAGAGGQLMQFGKNHAKSFTEKDIKTKFSDVAGQKEAKYELEEVVDFLKDPKKFSEIGARIPKGVLLVGPPGTGKTLLAKAVAGEAGVSFFHTSGSDFVEMFVGMGAARVRSLFEQGRKNAPCILFIDEIDAVGRARGSGLGGGHDEREQTLNQILVEMDGFDTSTGVIVIAATNRSDVLDPALLRPGRFDRQVSISLPDIDEREDILKIHAAKVKLSQNVDLRRVARATSGASGADLANLVNEAALFATREKRKVVEMIDFEEARDKMVLGVAKKSHVMTEEDKKLTANHESGHALLFYYLPDLDPLYKVTIIPHGNAGGVTMGLPEEDVSYLKKSTLLSHITMAMGGYVAEEIINGQTTTGPSSDIKQATDIARRMVTEWGMSSLGFISLGSESEPLFLGREIAQHKDFSEETAKKIDEEIGHILQTCMSNARRLLNEHRDKLDILAAELIKKETMDDREVRALLGFEQVGEKNSDIL